MIGKPIRTLTGLKAAVKKRKAVVVPKSMTVWDRPKPAAVMIHLSGEILFKLFSMGMYIYKKG